MSGQHSHRSKMMWVGAARGWEQEGGTEKTAKNRLGGDRYSLWGTCWRTRLCEQSVMISKHMVRL